MMYPPHCYSFGLQYPPRRGSFPPLHTAVVAVSNLTTDPWLVAGNFRLPRSYAWQKLKGHLDISPQYVIPEEDPWPLPLHGTPVGLYLNIIRAQKDLLMEHYPER